jgi:EVE domain
MSAPKNWVTVASADHVAIGRAGGFIQVGHGKRAPLARIHSGDRVALYSPAQQFGARTPLQAFTALGVVRDGEPYEADMGNGFMPFRRDVAFVQADAAPIRPLLDALGFAQPRASWGAKFRYGLFTVSDDDLRVIARAMHAELAALGLAP